MDAEIWIADDDADDIFFYQEALQQLKITDTIRIFRDGSAVMQQLQLNNGVPPRILLLDGHMPVMSGVDVIKDLCVSSLLQDCRVIVLTGTLSPLDEETIRRYNVPVYRKPSSPTDLLNLMRTIVSA